MKKIFTITVLAAAMIAAATSCQKDQFAGQNDNPQIQGEGLVFYATLENTDTKTTIANEGTAGYKVSWEDTDCISINGIEYVAVPDKENLAKATFNKKNTGDSDPEPPFKAYYPASIYDGTSATLPATQTYTADGSIASILPMYAEGSDLNLNFKNLCGLMKFTLTGTETVQHITLTDDTKALSGKFTVSGDAAVLDGAAKGGVTLDCGAGVELKDKEGKTFYVAVPAGSYDNLHIEYNTVNYAKYAKMKANATATVERNKVYPFTQTPTFKADWFYFEAVEAGATIGMSANGKAPTVSLQYSTDGGQNWNDFTVGSTTVTLSNIRDRVYFKANSSNENFAVNNSVYNNFTTPDAKVNVGGNIMYLLNGSSPGLAFSHDFCFAKLFDQNKIVSASDLKLPAKTLEKRCYNYMFKDCTNLVNAPALPTTTLAEQCYASMFSGCTALKTAPSLPATTLVKACYGSMFSGCSSLINAPALPATTAATQCYQSMFKDCKALETAPALPATTLSDTCYGSMFSGCTALKTAPSLPATTLNLACYTNMFIGCTALEMAPALPATTLATRCYTSMFLDCSKLSSVTMLATDVSADNCLSSWLSNAGTSEGSHTLYVDPTMTTNAKITGSQGNFTVTAYSGK